jgi:twitching motility protein PilI
MANKEALRALQARLAERLLTARTQPAGQSWLAVECRGRGLLFPLEQAGEIFALPPLLPVPHTATWFAGLANLRGGLYAVVDLARFLGLAQAASPDAAREHARVVTLASRIGVNAALWVDRLAGLRSAEQFSVEPADDTVRPAFAGRVMRDTDGRLWQELVLAELAHDERFLAAAA